MAKALSVDLRRRVVGAIADGMSCRQAAARFKVSPASAIRWRAQEHRTGDVAPKKQGGDRRSGRIEAQAAFTSGRCCSAACADFFSRTAKSAVRLGSSAR